MNLRRDTRGGETRGEGKQAGSGGTKTDGVRRVRIFIVAEAILREPGEKVSAGMERGEEGVQRESSFRRNIFFSSSFSFLLFSPLPSPPYFFFFFTSRAFEPNHQKNYQKYLGDSYLYRRIYRIYRVSRNISRRSKTRRV